MREEVAQLGRDFGRPEYDLCILGEGNVSGRANSTLWIKGSGMQMRDMTAEALVEVSLAPVLEALDHPPASEGEIRELLNSARADTSSPLLPSTETYMHAYLLSLPGVNFVGHSHPTPLLSLLSTEAAEELASKRLFPDEIVLCGPAACYVPYHPPGLPLAGFIRIAVDRYRQKWGLNPKTIWLQNHGLITLGATSREVLNSSLMSVKAARVLLGALQSGKEVRWLTAFQIMQIHNWQDEHFRQKMLNEQV